MNQKILSLALAASLLLNGFFIGGYWVAHRKAAELSSKTARVEAIARRLNLTAGQKKIFQDLKKRAGQIRKAHRKQTRQLHNDLINQLVAGSKQPENTDRIVHDMATQQTLYQKKIITLIQQFLAELTEEQKKIFLRISSGNKHLNALLSG
jgi:Spy/CpxP family protein refolding chaperone